MPVIPLYASIVWRVTTLSLPGLTRVNKKVQTCNSVAYRVLFWTEFKQTFCYVSGKLMLQLVHFLSDLDLIIFL